VLRFLLQEFKIIKTFMFLVTRLGDGSSAPSLGGLKVNRSSVPLSSTVTHDPIVVTRALWVKWKSPDKTQ